MLVFPLINVIFSDAKHIFWQLFTKRFSFRAILTGSYGSLFRVFDIGTKRDVTYEASKDVTKVKAVLKPKKVIAGADRLAAQKRKKDEIATDSLDYTRKVLHASWHPRENVLALCATNNLFMFEDAH